MHAFLFALLVLACVAILAVRKEVDRRRRQMDASLHHWATPMRAVLADWHRDDGDRAQMYLNCDRPPKVAVLHERRLRR
jgi:hypothetical protein